MSQKRPTVSESVKCESYNPFRVFMGVTLTSVRTCMANICVWSHIQKGIDQTGDACHCQSHMLRHGQDRSEYEYKRLLLHETTNALQWQKHTLSMPSTG